MLHSILTMLYVGIATSYWHYSVNNCLKIKKLCIIINYVFVLLMGKNVYFYVICKKNWCMVLYCHGASLSFVYGNVNSI